MRNLLLLTLIAGSAGGCVFSKLLPTAEQIACDSSANCPEGYRCDALQNVCRQADTLAACARDLDCPFGTTCSDGNCEPGCAEDGTGPPDSGT